MIKSKKVIATTLASLLLSLAMVVSPVAATGASLSLSPASGGSYAVGNSFAVSIWAKTGGDKIDTIRASLSFPANLLEVQSVALSSAYGAPSGGNAYSNTAGTIYWGGGAYGGTTTDATFATVTFKAKATGTAAVSFASGSLMLAAGQDVAFVTGGGSYTIGAGTTPKPVTPKPTTPTTPTTVKTITNSATVATAADGSVSMSGTASIAKAIIKINVEGGLLSDSVVADANGNWSWSLPKGFAPGTYSAVITAVNPDDETVTSVTTKSFEVKTTEAMEGATTEKTESSIMAWLATPLAWVIIAVILIIIVVIIVLVVKKKK